MGVEVGMLPEHKYVMVFSWVIPKEIELVHPFPEVMTVETVASTNIENRPLLTIGGKDSNGRMFIILRAFLPHDEVGCFAGFLVLFFLKCSVQLYLKGFM